MKLIDKESYIPYYVQIKHMLIDRIRNGTYQEHSSMPSEGSLAKEFTVTRMTVRKALDELKREGLIKSERGKASTISAEKIEQSLQRFYRFGKEIGDTGIAAQSRVVKRVQAVPPEEVLQIFDDLEGGEYYEIVRLRFYKDMPISLECLYIPCTAAPGIIDEPIEQVSIADLLEEKYGHQIEKATEYLYPRIADAYESEMLGVPVHSPIFQTERITRTVTGRIIEFRRSTIRGDKVKFSTELY